MWKRGKNVWGVALIMGMSVLLNSSPRAGHAGYHTSSKSKTIKVAHDLEVVLVEFGAFEYDQTLGEVVFTASDKLEMIPGKTYGWRVKLKTLRESVNWVERVTLPAQPEHWGVSSQVTLSPDRRSATTRSSSSVDKKGYISNYWIFSQGDPLGAYHLNLSIEGVEVARSSFNVK